MSDAKQTVFVSGGTGYIGSHCILVLLNEGYNVITCDNLTNSQSGSLRRVEEITGKSVTFYQCDLLDTKALNHIFNKHKIDSVIHFAALKSVVESMQVPFSYYKNNVSGTINLVEVMRAHAVHTMVFSSSCTVYGDPSQLPITEKDPTGNVTNVYGRTKYIMEELLKDLSKADEKWNIISLRYFNPVGAHSSGRLGEAPTKTAFANLMPYVGDVASGKRPSLTIFGNDYDTVDGTGVRDYIHVMDLVEGHVLALSKLNKEHLKYKSYNLGLGHGTSVLEFVSAFESITKTKIPYTIEGRRLGDASAVYCDNSLAIKELEFKPTRDFKIMCEDYWRWQTMNPDGYKDDKPYAPTSLDVEKQE